jgi:hypothetical protein
LPDILLDGLPVLDLLELTPNTSTVAALTQRNQSSISRLYRRVSDRLGLQFSKQPDGRYRAQANQPLLNSLRLASQWLRLHQRPFQLRWLSCAGACGATNLPPPLPHDCGDQRLIHDLLSQRILDLAVLTPKQAPANGPAELVWRPLTAGAGLLLRADVEAAPAIAALVAGLRLE